MRTRWTDLAMESSGAQPEQTQTLPGGIAAPEGMLTLWHHVHGTDGFFICRMRRRA